MAVRLSSACRSGNLDIVKKAANERTINKRNDFDYTPLNVACYYGNFEIAEFLLDSGADVTKDNHQGWTPLHAASMQGNASLVRLLLDRGAACVVNSPGAPSSSSTNRKLTPLIVACRSTCDRNGEIIQILIEAGADVNLQSAQGRTPLMEASASGKSNKVVRLLKAGADVHAVDHSGFSALHMAVPYFDIVKILIDHGADVNVKDCRDETPLERKNISPQVISLLLEHGAGADIPCCRHKTCKTTIAWCLYKTSRASAKREKCPFGPGLEKLNQIEKYLIKLEVAGLSSGRLLDPLQIEHWNLLSRDEFKVECQTELVMMKTGKIPGSNATYLDALLQRPHALRLVDPKSLELCRLEFKIYGELIWSRFLSGRRRLPLIGECTDFFSVAKDVPYLPSECAEEILSYLSEKELKTVLEIYQSAKPRPSTPPEIKKRANPDSPLQIMKHLKVD